MINVTLETRQYIQEIIMESYVALLRGINVSGHKKIKMADLSLLFQNLGFSKVNTYIQSGNIVFLAPQQEHYLIRDVINTAIQKQYNFDVPVSVLTKSEFAAVHHAIPLDDFNVSDIVEHGRVLYEHCV